MDNETLNQRLIELGDQATSAHEILRGVTDALAVIGQSTVRAAAQDLTDIDDLEAWHAEGIETTAQSEKLLREAAALLERTADRLTDAAGTPTPAEDD